MQSTIRYAAVVVLVLSLGLHWTLLQTLAWTGMFIQYSRDGSVGEALVKTFDGQHPCGLCKGIAQGRAAERKSESSQPLKKMEFITERLSFFIGAPQHFRLLPAIEESARMLTHGPPVPPPRSIPA